MLSTTIYVSVFLVLLIFVLISNAIILKWGCAWAKISNVSLKKAVALTIVLFLVQLPVTVFFEEWTPATDREAMFVGLLGMGVGVVLAGSLLAVVLKARFFRAIQAWLPTLIPAIATLLFISLIFRPYFSEAFKIPANSMAPTILGPHWQGKCPRCGAPAFGSVREFESATEPSGQLMMCSREYQSCVVQDFPSEVHSGDRILVNKLFEPRRWDIIVFRSPENPPICYAKRIVGLPGEEVVIRDGSVWINGESIEPPEGIRGIEYLSELQPVGKELWGRDGSPALLGPDEYFVLGDFSAQSLDSRLWRNGAPGHPPYAVPASHIVGVVTHIHWPPSRWRILR